MLITGKKDALFASKTVAVHNGRWCVIDELQAQSWKHVILLGWL